VKFSWSFPLSTAKQSPKFSDLRANDFIGGWEGGRGAGEVSEGCKDCNTYYIH
jgi:hypothetical protein